MSAQPTSATESELNHDEIAARARQLWIERGRPGGRDLEHWLDAERQLREEYSTRGKRGTGGGNEAEKRLDGLIDVPQSPARRTPKGEQL